MADFQSVDSGSIPDGRSRGNHPKGGFRESRAFHPLGEEREGSSRRVVTVSISSLHGEDRGSIPCVGREDSVSGDHRSPGEGETIAQ